MRGALTVFYIATKKPSNVAHQQTNIIKGLYINIGSLFDNFNEINELEIISLEEYFDFIHFIFLKEERALSRTSRARYPRN